MSALRKALPWLAAAGFAFPLAASSCSSAPKTGGPPPVRTTSSTSSSGSGSGTGGSGGTADGGTCVVDGKADGTKTDVDCGGSACPACAVGKKCKVAGDCLEGVCTPGLVCAAATCSDLVKNGDETDVDCGGSCPDACASGKVCKVKADCTSEVCTKDLCAAPSCSDKVKNGTETDVDCGGSCPPCANFQVCAVAADCKSANCDTSDPKNLYCSCPAKMAVVPASGAKYCIDVTEVSYGDYLKFWTANPLQPDMALCAWNQSYTPNGPMAWPPVMGAPDAGESNFTSDPVHYVNWCDALAYCTYVGKHLCGKIGGGANAVADSHDPSKSAWYNACTSHGFQVPYPYGSPFNAATCNGDGYAMGGAIAAPYPVVDAADNPVVDACVGGIPGIYEMSGNVAEWEDSCSGMAGANDLCLVRGGSYLSDAQALRCDNAADSRARTTTADDVGFRCCQ